MASAPFGPPPELPHLDPASRRLFLHGPAGAGKTTAAVARLAQMLADGVPGDSILVLAPQRTLAQPYYRLLRQPELAPGGLVSVLTIGGLAQRMLSLFWPLVVGPAGFAHPGAPPVFLTLETAQYYMAHLVRPLLEQQRLFDTVVIDRNRLYSQILDNLNKAAVVGFPQAQIGQRLQSAWQGEPGQLHVYEDVQTCASLFRQFCLEHNLLDFSLQIELFWQILWQMELPRQYLRDNYRHLIYDNIEEDFPIAHDLIREWASDFDSLLLVYDQGASYRRFLGADPHSANSLRQLCDQELEFPESLVPSRELQIFSLRLSAALSGRSVRSPSASANATSSAGSPSAGPPAASADWIGNRSGLPNLSSQAVTLRSFRFFPEMLDWTAETIAGLVYERGVPPGEIVVLTPFLSDALRFSLAERLAGLGVPARSHRPSRSLREEPATHCLLTLAALAHPSWDMAPSRYDVAYALLQALDGLDLVRAQLLAEIVYRPRSHLFSLSSFDLIRPEMQERITYRLGERYEKLRLWLMAAQENPQELDHFLSRLFGELLSQPGFGFHTSYDAGRVAANLIESVQKFRWVAGPVLEQQGSPLGQEYLRMVQDGVIAAQYLSGWQSEQQDWVLLSPAYTFLMANYPVQIQFWLDIGSQAWSERLYQPLTHPYVLSREWLPGRLWTDADELEAGRAALERLVNGLVSRCRSSLYLGLSDLNEQGYEQRGALLRALQRLLREAQP